MIRIYLILCVLMLSACSSASTPTHFTAPDTPGGRMCTSQCGQARNYCREDCTFHQHQCVVDVQAQALKDYQDYVTDQFRQKQSVEFRARDFERMTPCDDGLKACTDPCEEKFRSCFITCGGVVY